jgi:hypothetical protein
MCGSVSREIQKRRKDWVKNFLGDEAAENYQFGDITKKALLSFTGEDDYQFGDGKKHSPEHVQRRRQLVVLCTFSRYELVPFFTQ